jgi:hypothetical protein
MTRVPFLVIPVLAAATMSAPASAQAFTLGRNDLKVVERAG